MKYAIGADIGGTSVKLGIFSETGNLLDKWEIRTNTHNHGENILPDIQKSIENYLHRKQIARTDILGVGFGIPGSVLPDGMVEGCVNLGWGAYNVVETFQNMSGFPTFAVNDANAAALGEAWRGSGKGYENVVMITLGTGIGGGVVVDGKIHAGAFGAGGEIGHMSMIENEKEHCNCGKTGCLEQYASAKGLARVAARLLQAGPTKSSLRSCESITARVVCEHAREGDEMAKEAIGYSMGLLGKAMALIAAVIDPQVFIIGGGLAKSGDLLLSPIQEAYRKHVFYVSRNTEIRLAALGNDAGIFGGARLVLGSENPDSETLERRKKEEAGL